MRPIHALGLLLLVAPLAGCLGGDAGETNSIDDEAQWFIAQAQSAGGDVSGFVMELPERSPCDLSTDVSASAQADASGASANAGGSSASASANGARAAAPCFNAQASASASGASASAAGISASASYDSIALEVVPDTSALGELKDFAVLVFGIKDGVASHVKTVLSSEMERVQTTATDASGAALVTAKSFPFTVPFDGLDLAAGDQIAFVMAAVDGQQATTETVLADTAGRFEGLPVDKVDYGMAFRFVDAAQADAEQAAAEFQAFANSGRAQAQAAGQAGADAAQEGAAQAANAAQAGATMARSQLDDAIATGKVHAIGAYEQVRGYDLAFFAEFTKGALNGLENVQFITDSINVDMGLDAGLQPMASVEEISIAYTGPFASGWGLGLGAYGGSENGNVEWSVDADVRGQTFSQSGSLTAAGPVAIGSNPAYVLESAGNEAQTLAFDVARRAEDGATTLYALHMDIASDIESLIGATEVLPVEVPNVPNMSLNPVGGGVMIETQAIGPVVIAGIA